MDLVMSVIIWRHTHSIRRVPSSMELGEVGCDGHLCLCEKQKKEKKKKRALF